MYLARLRLNKSRMALGWCANPYRVHQRLAMACPKDSRLLFRLEDTPDGMQILMQSHIPPNWDLAFGEFQVLNGAPEFKPINPQLVAGRCYRFRLLANPTVKRDGKRLGLLREQEQRVWLERKLEQAGAKVLGCAVSGRGLQRSQKNPVKEAEPQTHLAVLFQGALLVRDPALVLAAIQNGIGAAKGYGFGLLSLAPAALSD